MDVNAEKRLTRVLIAKIGLDGHNRGAQVVAHGLRQSGMEVIYTGIRQTPAAVARAAMQEDVDVIGISSMVGAHLAAVQKLMNELQKLKVADIPVIVGGIIPEEDYGALQAMGVSRIFPPGRRFGKSSSTSTPCGREPFHRRFKRLARQVHEMEAASWFLGRSSLPPGLAPDRRPPFGAVPISIRYERFIVFKPPALVSL